MQARLGLLDLVVFGRGDALRQRLPQELRLISLEWARRVIRGTLAGPCV